MKTTSNLRLADRTIHAGTSCRRATPEEIAALDPRRRLYALPDEVAVVFDDATAFVRNRYLAE